MMLFGWTCEWCDKYHPTIHGAPRNDGTLTVKCETCGEIEKIRNGREVIV